MKNLNEAVQKVLVRQYSKVNTMLPQKQILNEPEKAVFGQHIPNEVKSCDENSSDRIRLQRFKKLEELQEKGYSTRAMARHLNMSKQTIKIYLDMKTLPGRPQNRNNPLEKYFPYIKKRMEKESDILLTTLLQELKSKGYKGAYSTLSEASPILE